MADNTPNILVFGATGRTGKIIVKNLLIRGYPVSGFVRSIQKAHKIKHPKYTIVHGKIHNYQKVHEAIQEHDIIICALGTSSLLPNTIISRGLENILKAMKASARKRLIFQSSLGVGSTKGQLGLIYNLILIPFLLRFVFKDKERQEMLISESDLDWTIVKPAHFIPFPLPKPYRIMVPPQRPRLMPVMSRVHTADFMVTEALQPEHVRCMVTLSYF